MGYNSRKVSCQALRFQVKKENSFVRTRLTTLAMLLIGIRSEETCGKSLKKFQTYFCFAIATSFILFNAVAFAVGFTSAIQFRGGNVVNLLYASSPLSNIILWFLLYSRRSSLLALPEKMDVIKEQRVFKMKQHFRFVSGFRLVAVLISFFVSLAVTVAITIIAAPGKVQSRVFFTKAFGSYFWYTYYGRIFRYFMVFFRVLYRILLSYCISVFYVTLFSEFKYIIKAFRYAVMDVRRYSDDELAKVFTSIFRLSCYMEEKLTGPVFLFVVKSFLYVFMALSWVVHPFNQCSDTAICMESVLDGILFVITYASVLYCAAEVSEEYKGILSDVKLLQGDLQPTCRGHEFEKFVESRSIVFTGWKMFKLDRNFMLSSCGALLTYNLLILQFHTFKHDDIKNTCIHSISDVEECYNFCLNRSVTGP